MGHGEEALARGTGKTAEPSPEYTDPLPVHEMMREDENRLFCWLRTKQIARIRARCKLAP